MKIKEFLKKNNKLSKKILNIDFHLCILNKDIDTVLSILSKKGIIDIKNFSSEKDIADLLLELIEKSDDTNDKFDEKIYTEIVRIGTNSDRFYGGHNHNKWNTGMFEDDDFGFGKNNTSLNDDYNDYENKKRL